MLAALNTKEAHSKHSKKYDDIPNHKIGDLVMIRNFDKNSYCDAKNIPNFTAVQSIGSRQLRVTDPTGRLREVIICCNVITPYMMIMTCV